MAEERGSVEFNANGASGDEARARVLAFTSPRVRREKGQAPSRTGCVSPCRVKLMYVAPRAAWTVESLGNQMCPVRENDVENWKGRGGKRRSYDEYRDGGDWRLRRERTSEKGEKRKARVQDLFPVVSHERLYFVDIHHEGGQPPRILALSIVMCVCRMRASYASE